MAFGLMWVFRPERARALVMFGLSFAVGTALHLAIAWPPERWFEPACDAISFVYAAAAFGVGAAFVMLAVLPLGRAHSLVRLAVGVVMGVVVLGGIVVAFPNCLSGPYAGLDPWLVETWASRIIESRPIWQSVIELPDLVVAIALPLALAVCVTAYRTLRSEGRDRWMIYGLFLAVAVVVTIVIVRGGRIAGILAVPAGAWVIAAVRARYLATRSILWAGGLLGSWIAFAGIFVLAGVAGLTLLAAPAVTETPPRSEVLAGRSTCMMPKSFAELAKLPPQRAMAPVDLGAHILAFTPHSVVAAPYPRNFRRNAEGLRDGFLFFNEPLDKARELLTERGITLVVACPAMVETQTDETTAPDSFARLVVAGKLPAWLHEISMPEATLKIYTVRAGS